jgi:DnaJ-class molecular chaperone
MKKSFSFGLSFRVAYPGQKYRKIGRKE